MRHGEQPVYVCIRTALDWFLGNGRYRFWVSIITLRVGAQFRLPQKRQATQRAKRAYQSVRQHRHQQAVKHPARIPPLPERRVPSTPHRRVVPPCGRDVPPQATGSGEASPHTPPPTAEPASPLRSDPPKGRLHCAALLSLCSVRTLLIGRLHCTPLTVCAGSRGGFSPQSCSANVFRPGIHASCT